MSLYVLSATAKIMLLTVCCFTCVTQETNARVIFKEKTRYYDVSGSNGAEIYRSMAINGPNHGGMAKEILASTQFTFAVENVNAEYRGHRCVIKSVDVIVGVTFTYPRWRNRRGASSQTRRAWNDFQRLAILHEKEHVKITRSFAESYERTLLRSRRTSASDCKSRSLGEKFRTSIAIKKHERLHKLFDKRDLRPGGAAYDSLYGLVKAR